MPDTTDMLPMDIHCHSKHSFDGECSVADLCNAALSKNIAVLAITDHYELSASIIDYHNVDTALTQSLADTLKAKQDYADKLTVLSGIELGQPLENQPKAEEILKSHDFDFVIAAMHNAPGGQDFYYYSPDNDAFLLEVELERYYTTILSMVDWASFDCAAHITYPFRYINQFHDDYPAHKWDDHIEELVRHLAQQGLAMEINTSGMKFTPPYTMPELRWVKRFRELGGEKLCLGADGHTTDHVGSGIREGLQIAIEAGFRYLCYFKHREAVYINISKT